MKTRITRQEARGHAGTLKIGYADAQSLLRFQNAYGYNAGVYGWNFDSYCINGVVINTGYRGTVGKSVDYELLRKYESKARALQSKNGLTYNQMKAYTNRLLNNFIAKALEA